MEKKQQRIAIIEGVRTPMGKMGGALAGVQADNLAAHVQAPVVAEATPAQVVAAAEVVDAVVVPDSSPEPEPVAAPVAEYAQPGEPATADSGYAQPDPPPPPTPEQLHEKECDALFKNLATA